MAVSSRLRHDMRMQELLEIGVMMIDGHFDYHNGYHGNSYLNPHVIMHDSSLLMQYAQDLKGALPLEIRSKAHLVSGPITGGALLAHDLSITLEADRDFGPTNKVYFAPIHKHDGEFQLRLHYQELVKGKNVILADDVVHTGLTMVKAKSLLTRYGANVIAIVTLFDRNVKMVELPNFYALDVCHDHTEKPVLASDCPDCKLGRPITQF